MNTDEDNQYIQQMRKYETEYRDFPNLELLIKNVLEADILLASDSLPQTLTKLVLPNDMQNQIYKHLAAKYCNDNDKFNTEWNQLSNDLPKLEADLRDFRDYLENQYGMWAYITSEFTYQLAQFLAGRPALEIMAGNGYISKGLQDNEANVIATDSLSWKDENETGRHLVTKVEKLSAMAAFNKYEKQVDYIIMCWSPDGVPIDNEILNAIRSSSRDIQLIVIGEQNGATNSQLFWENAEFSDTDAIRKLNRFYPNFDLIKDHVYLVK